MSSCTCPWAWTQVWVRPLACTWTHMRVCECASMWADVHTHTHTSMGRILNWMMVETSPVEGAAFHSVLLECSPGSLLFIPFPVWLPAFLSVKIITSWWKKGKEATWRLCPPDAKKPPRLPGYVQKLTFPWTDQLSIWFANLCCDLIWAPVEWWGGGWNY